MVSTRTLVLECGTDAVALGTFSRRGARLCLHDFAVENFAPNDGVGRDCWLENTRAAFLSLAARTKIRGSVILVFPAHLTLTKFLKIPRVEPAQRAKIMGFEAAQNIPYALTDVVWGSTVTGETASGLEVVLATAKLEVLDPLCAAAQQAGFEPRLILPAPFATLAGFKLSRSNGASSRESFLGLNLGPRSTTLLLVEPGRFALRTFAPGIDAAASDAGSAKAKLLQEITRSLLHFQWRSGMAKPEQVCFAGNKTQLPALIDAVNAKLKLPGWAPDLRSAIDFAGNAAANPAMNDAALVDLIGAAATQLFPDQPVVNLLPPQAHQRMSYRQRRPLLIAATLLMAAVLIPPLMHERQLCDEARKKTAAIERELAPWRIRDANNRERLRRVDALNQRALAYQTIVERRAHWVHFMADLQSRLVQVEDVWLEKMQVMPAPISAGESMKLLISGRMLDRVHPLSQVSAETFARVKTLLGGLAESPFVSTIESERFDHQQPGILKFDFILVTNPPHAL